MPVVRVDTPYGHGTIVSSFGNKVVVSLEDIGSELEFFVNEITYLEEAPKTARLINGEYPKEELSPSLQAMEALRFGLVPMTLISDLTIGFDEIEQWVISRLPYNNNNDAIVSEVCGPFGSGKSHTMEVVRWIARREGYLTARVEVDGDSVSLGDPATFLNSLWPTLSGLVEISETPLLDVYRRAIHEGHAAPSIVPGVRPGFGIDRVKDNYKTIRELGKKDLIDRFNADIESVLGSSPDITASQLIQEIRQTGAINPEDLNFRPLIGRSVSERPFNFLETIIGNAIVAKLAGYEGLLITVDEFEVEHLGDRWDRIESLFDVLVDYLSGEFSHPNSPLGMVFATVGQEGHAGDGLVERLLLHDAEPFECRVLDFYDLVELGQRIFGHYCIANSMDVDDYYFVHGEIQSMASEFRNEPSMWGSSGLTRAWIKYLVAYFDQNHGPPEGG